MRAFVRARRATRSREGVRGRESCVCVRARRFVVIMMTIDPGALWAYFFLTVAATAGATGVDITLTRELGFERAPEALSTYYALEFAATMVKPLYASASDSFSIGGRRRAPHVALGCAFGALCVCALSRATTRGWAYACGVGGAVGSAHAYAALDGYVAERYGAQQRREHAIRAQSIAMATRTFGAICGAGVGVVVLACVSARTAVGLSSGWLACAAACAWFWMDESASHGVDRDGCDEDDGHSSGTSASIALAGSSDGMLARAKRRYAPLASATFARNVAAVVLYRIAPTALDTFGAYTYWAFEDVLPNWGYGVVSLFASVGGFAAACAFGAAFGREVGSGDVDGTTRWTSTSSSPSSETSPTGFGKLRVIADRIARAPLWVLFMFGAVADAALGLCRLFIVWWPPRGAGAVWALSFVHILTTFGLRIGYMPILALAAIIAPPKIEAVGFATLIFASDVGSLVAATVAARVTRDFNLGAPTALDPDGARTIPTGRSWNALDLFILVVAACKVIIPLCSVPWLVSDRPDASAADADDDQNADADRLIPS